MKIASSAASAVVIISLLSACGSGGSASGNAGANAAGGDAAHTNAAASTANASAPAGGPTSGTWTYAANGCAAVMMTGPDSGLRIGQTREVLTIGFRGPASATSGSEVQLSAWAGANASEATSEVGQLVEHDGVQWLEFSVPNNEPGGWHDLLANSPSISVAYGSPRQQVTVSLAESNAVMARLRSCAGL